MRCVYETGLCARLPDLEFLTLRSSPSTTPDPREYQDLDKLLPSTAVFLVVRIECPGFRWLHRRRANAHV